MSLRSLVEELDRTRKTDIDEQYLSANLDTNPYLNKDAFKAKMDSLDELSDTELKELVRCSYVNILEHINNRTDMSYIKSFSSARFINCLCNVLADRIHNEPHHPLEPELVMCCNKLAYDYITSKNAKEEVKQNFLTLSRVVNKFSIDMLTRYGIDLDLASLLALARYSTMEESVNIRRLNFIIVQQNPNIMTLAKVVGVYESLFSKVRDLFIHTFIDNYDEWFEQIKEHNPEMYESTYKMYIREADAAMCILNSTDKFIIKQTIRDLLDACSYRRLYSENLRYSLRSIAPVEGLNSVVVEAMIEMERDERIYIL